MTRDIDGQSTDLAITPLGDRPGIAVAGDVDFRSLDAFAEAVADVARQHTGDVHIDLAQLTFIEVSGMRVLAETASQLAEQSRRLVLDNLAPHLHPVLKVVGWYEAAD